jgi:branched-chain amino acid transport system ATP-binding protein
MDLPASDATAAAQAGRPDGAEVLAAEAVTVRFGGLTAIEDVSLTLARHEVLGLIGPNGAGKTTFVNVLTGFQRPTAGRVLLAAEDVTGWPAHRLGRAGLARTFQGVRLFRGLSVIENVEAAAVGSGLKRREAERRAARILCWMHFEDKAFELAETLPYGGERLVGIGRALAMAPRFVLLDEPAAGLSDAECDELMRLIARIPKEFGCGVLLIEHNMRVVMGACHRIHVIESGRTIAEGTPEAIQRDPAVIEAYLGTKTEGRARRRAASGG